MYRHLDPSHQPPLHTNNTQILQSASALSLKKIIFNFQLVRRSFLPVPLPVIIHLAPPAGLESCLTLKQRQHNCGRVAVRTPVLLLLLHLLIPPSHTSVRHVTVSQCHSVTVSQCHSVTVSQCHGVTESQCHSVTVSQCHSLQSVLRLH